MAKHTPSSGLAACARANLILPLALLHAVDQPIIENFPVFPLFASLVELIDR